MSGRIYVGNLPMDIKESELDGEFIIFPFLEIIYFDSDDFRL